VGSPKSGESGDFNGRRCHSGFFVQKRKMTQERKMTKERKMTLFVYELEKGGRPD
jgi:hypothetical protein